MKFIIPLLLLLSQGLFFPLTCLANEDATPPWAAKLGTVTANIEKLYKRPGPLPEPIAKLLVQLNKLLGPDVEKKVRISYRDFYQKNWDHLPMDTSDIEMGVKILGSIEVNGKPFIANGSDPVWGNYYTRFMEIPQNSQAGILVESLLRIENRYSDWLRDYRQGLGVDIQGKPIISPEAKKQALQKLFPKYEVIYCSSCSVKAGRPAEVGKILDLVNIDLKSRGIQDVTLVAPGGCQKLCGLSPIRIYVTEEKKGRSLLKQDYLRTGNKDDAELKSTIQEILNSADLKTDEEPTPYDSAPVMDPVLDTLETSICAHANKP